MIPELIDEKGTFILSNYGSAQAIMFRGEPDFLNRCANLILNYMLDYPRSRQILEYDTQTIYVGMTRDEFGELLKRFYSGLIIINHEIENIDDEIAVEKLAQEKAAKFLDERLTDDNLLTKNYATAGVEFAMHHSPHKLRRFSNSDEKSA